MICADVQEVKCFETKTKDTQMLHKIRCHGKTKSIVSLIYEWKLDLGLKSVCVNVNIFGIYH